MAEELAQEIGSGDVIMVYQPRSLEQIEGWLLGWGDKMEVLAPAALRDRLADIAAHMLVKHQKG